MIVQNAHWVVVADLCARAKIERALQDRRVSVGRHLVLCIIVSA